MIEYLFEKRNFDFIQQNKKKQYIFFKKEFKRGFN